MDKTALSQFMHCMKSSFQNNCKWFAKLFPSLTEILILVVIFKVKLHKQQPNCLVLFLITKIWGNRIFLLDIESWFSTHNSCFLCFYLPLYLELNSFYENIIYLIFYSNDFIRENWKRKDRISLFLLSCGEYLFLILRFVLRSSFGFSFVRIGPLEKSTPLRYSLSSINNAKIFGK